MLTERGYSAIGVDEVLRAASVTKGSFYHCFGSKQAYGAALVEAYAGYFAAKLDRWFLDEHLSPLDRLRHFMADAEAGMARHGFQRGCLVGNLGQEMGALPEPFRQQITDVFTDWQRRTAACLRAAQSAGQLAADADADVLAELFWIGWEGAVLRAKLERSDRPLRLYGRGFVQLLQAQA
jgi:TetR/AcrR family transcriptional repressor of nem operon